MILSLPYNHRFANIKSGLWSVTLSSTRLPNDLRLGTQPCVLVWPGLAQPGLLCVSCDPFHWNAIKHSPSFSSSHRTSVTLTAPKQTSRQPNLLDLLTEILKTVTGIRLQTQKSIPGLSDFVNSGLTSQKAKLLRRFCDGYDPGHVNMRHTYHKSESFQKPAVEESTSH